MHLYGDLSILTMAQVLVRRRQPTWWTLKKIGSDRVVEEKILYNSVGADFFLNPPCRLPLMDKTAISKKHLHLATIQYVNKKIDICYSM